MFHERNLPVVKEVKAYLESLTWDGKSRIDTWLIDYCTAEDIPRVREAGNRVLLDAVNKIYQREPFYCDNLILRGAQGIGKSSAVAILGGKWYSRINGIITSLSGLKWIVEAEDSLPWTGGGFADSSIFIHTTNTEVCLEETLKDMVGCSPIKLNGNIDLENLAKDRDQLWAEATENCTLI